MQKLKYGSDIKAARLALIGIAQELRHDHDMPEIAEKIETVIKTHLYRKFSGRHGAAFAKPLTAAMVEQIKYYLLNTNKPQQEIATLLGINAGRVSEINNRLRDAAGKPK